MSDELIRSDTGLLARLGIRRPAQGPVAKASGRSRGSDLVRLARHYLLRAGPYRVAGIGLLLIAGLVAVLVVLPQRELAAGLQSRLQLLERVPAQVSHEAVSGTAFLARLPVKSAVPGILGVVYAKAAASQIQLDHGSYLYVPGKYPQPDRYEIVLPVTGAYSSIRTFVDTTLAAVPAMALEEISLTRDDIASDSLSAELRMVVYLQGGGK